MEAYTIVDGQPYPTFKHVDFPHINEREIYAFSIVRQVLNKQRFASLFDYSSLIHAHHKDRKRKYMPDPPEESLIEEACSAAGTTGTK